MDTKTLNAMEVAYISYIYKLPVVPHKAVAEVSRIGNYRRDWLLWVTAGRAKTLMDRTVQVSRWLIDELTDSLTNWLTVLLINWQSV